MFHPASPDNYGGRTGILTDHLHDGRPRSGSLTETAMTSSSPLTGAPRRKSVHFSLPLVTEIQEIPDSISKQRPLTIDAKHVSADYGWIEANNHGKEDILPQSSAPSHGFNVGLVEVAERPEHVHRPLLRQNSVDLSYIPISVRSYVGLRKNRSARLFGEPVGLE